MLVGRNHPDWKTLVMPLSTDASAYEHSLELTAQELQSSPAYAGMVEIEDICDVDPLLRTGTFAANADWARIDETAGSVEIELSAEQVVGLLLAGDE
jgi:hypothetical protein